MFQPSLRDSTGKPASYFVGSSKKHSMTQWGQQRSIEFLREFAFLSQPAAELWWAPRQGFLAPATGSSTNVFVSFGMHNSSVLRTPTDEDFLKNVIVLILNVLPAPKLRSVFELMTRSCVLELKSAVAKSAAPNVFNASRQALDGFVASATARCDALQNSDVRNRARAVIEALAKALDDCGFAGKTLPELAVSEKDDGAAFIEWLFPDRRLGFAVETREEDSSWYYVTKASAGGLMFSGDLSAATMGRLVRWAIMAQVDDNASR
jgi:hypothetical protein